MMPATKHFDPVVGIDTHIIQPTGPVPPVPIPHPFIGMIMDPMDYVPVVGSTVNINFLPRALAGTQGIASPPHIPIGGMFVKPPSNECECFMGVATINCDGDALCHTTLPALSCQCIGMPPIPRVRKKGSMKSLVLPTSTVLTIPAGPPVLIAGPPTISLMALGMKLGMGALGKAFKKAKASKIGKKIKTKVDKAKSKLQKKSPSANKGCGRPGEPVDVVTGANVDDFIDWQSPARPHFTWQRFYSSTLSQSDGPLGRGFRHSWQYELTKTEAGFSYLDPEGETVEFLPLDPVTGTSVNDGFILKIDSTGRYQLKAAHHPILWFQRHERRTMLAGQMEHLGVSISLEYGDRDQLLRIVDADGRQLCCDYNRLGKIEKVSLHSDRETGSGLDKQTLVVYTYDDLGRMTVCSDAADRESRYEYDGRHLMIRKTDRNGYSYYYQYDELERCEHSWGDDGLYQIRLEYHPQELHTIVHWADGPRFEYYFSESGALTKIVDPTGGVTLFETDDAGKIVKEIEPNGDEVSYVYDQFGGHTHRVDASGQVLLPMHLQPLRPDGLAYELPSTPVGWMLGQRSTVPVVDTGTIDQWIAQAIPASAIQALEKISAWQPIAAVQKTDALGRITEEIDSTARTAAYNYDANGNVTRKRDADGAFWSYQYKSWNLLDQERSPIGAVTKYDYNIREAVTRVMDPGGTVTEYDYDACDRLTHVSRGGKLRDRYVYTPGGNLCEKYDAQGELLLRLEPGPYDTFAKIELNDGGAYQYQFTPRARIATMSGPDHLVQFEYDAFDHVRLDARNGKGVERKWLEPRTEVVSLLGKFEAKYHHDSQGLLELIDPTGRSTAIASDGRGRFLRTTADGLSELISYDQRGLCTNHLVKLPLGGIWQRSYEYSSGGHLLRSSDSRQGRTEYQYDAAHRLVMRRHAGKDDIYQYDLAGNLIAKPGLMSVKLGHANQLETAGDETFSYNDRGHIAQRIGNDGTAHHYRYNGLDQLVQVTTEAGFQWTSQYDGLNRRIMKSWTDGYESHDVEFFWEHRRLAAEILDGQRLRTYLYGDRDSFVPLLMVEYDTPDAAPETGRCFHLLSDQRGQIVEVLAHDGRTVWQLPSQPYGDGTPSSGEQFEFNIRLAGQYADDEIGLYYNRYRYYDASLGRYIQSDPIGLAGGLNTYAYTRCPLVQTDLEGLNHGKQKSSKKSASNDSKPVVAETPATPVIPATAIDEVKSLGSLAGKSNVDITAQMNVAGYSSITGKNGGTIWTKPLPDGNTAVVRVDPAMVRAKPKGFADEAPHVHKEIVPTSKVSSGNYKPGDASKLDDFGVPSTDPGKTHIPGGH